MCHSDVSLSAATVANTSMQKWSMKWPMFRKKKLIRSRSMKFLPPLRRSLLRTILRLTSTAILRYNAIECREPDNSLPI